MRRTGGEEGDCDGERGGGREGEAPVAEGVDVTGRGEFCLPQDGGFERWRRLDRAVLVPEGFEGLVELVGGVHDEWFSVTGRRRVASRARAR